MSLRQSFLSKYKPNQAMQPRMLSGLILFSLEEKRSAAFRNS